MKHPLKYFAAIAVLLFGGVIAFVLPGFSNKQGEQAYDEEQYGPAAPVVWSKPVKSVVFSHKSHTMGAGLSCDACHDGLFEMAAGAAEGNADFTMKSLYAGKYCGACHDGSMAFASNTRCTTCHVGVRGYNRLVGDKAASESKKGH